VDRLANKLFSSTAPPPTCGGAEESSISNLGPLVHVANMRTYVYISGAVLFLCLFFNPSMLSSCYGYILSLCVAFTYAASNATYNGTSPPVVTVKNGTYIGIHDSVFNQDFFLGIPFAQPPIGDFRFRVPQSLDSSWSIRSATEWPPFCVGYGRDNTGHDMSEDCLYLNIFRPCNNTSNASLPIAVWIHGGGLFMGGTNDRRYNLSFIIQNSVNMGKPMIGISIQYRLSGWGFLGGKEALEGGATNLGFRDQRLALHWIQENIDVFGGDPSKVTIWGESAGAQSVGAQFLAYNGKDSLSCRSYS
jgi:Carboxylesterase family